MDITVHIDPLIAYAAIGGSAACFAALLVGATVGGAWLVVATCYHRARAAVPALPSYKREDVTVRL